MAATVPINMVGIISYGTYIPKKRIKTADIAAAWGKNSAEIEANLGVWEKAVASLDEDTTTLSVEATLRALSFLPKQLKIDAVMTGSESHPYTVKPTSTIVGNLVGFDPNYLALDSQFACKAASAAVQLVWGLIQSGKINNGLVIGADTGQAKLADALEFSAGSAATALILGSKDVIAELTDFTSYSTDTPDFWRREGQKFPSHAGRFSGEPAYFHHVISASQALMEKANAQPSDFDYVVLHMPNGKFPQQAAKRLGFSKKQLEPSLVVTQIGNPYSASSLTGLAAVLDIAKPRQKIFMCSYGSGSGSDSFILETTTALSKHQAQNKYRIKDQLAKKTYLNYQGLLQLMHAKGYLQ